MKRFADVRRLLEVALLGGLVCAASEIYGAVPTAEARDEGLGRSSGVGSFQSPVSEDLRIVDGMVYHVHVLTAWFRNGRRGPRPLRAWETLQGSVAGADRTGRYVFLAIPATRVENGVVVGTSIYVAIQNFPEELRQRADEVMLFALRVPKRSLKSETYGEILLFDAGRRLSPKEATEYLSQTGSEHRSHQTNSTGR